MTELPAGTNDVAPIANDALTSASTLSVAAISVINQTVAYYLIMQKKIIQISIYYLLNINET